MNRYFKTEGNILYPSKDDHNRPMLTWGPFYFHSFDKAQAKTLYKLSRVLGCNIEDLLENPIK